MEGVIKMVFDLITGPQSLQPTNFINEHDLFLILRIIIANYDKTGLRFPIQKLILGPRALKMFGSRANSELVTIILTRKLYDYLEKSRISIEMENGEVVLDAKMPYLTIADRCDLSLRSAPAKFHGTVRRSTHLSAGGSVSSLSESFKTAAILQGDVDFDFSLSTSVSARFGKSFFGNCITKFNAALPLSALAHGHAFIGVKAIATDVRVERRFENQPYAQGRTLNLDIDLQDLINTDPNDGTKPFLVFKIRFKLEVILKSLKMDAIHVANCHLKFGGLRLFSYCELIRKTMNQAVQRFASDLNEIHAPRILRKVEQILHYRIGDEIAIPLLLADQKAPLVASLVEKADTITKLKADLVRDLANVVEAING